MSSGQMAIENLVYRSRVTGWSNLSASQKREALEVARERAFSKRGSGSLVALVTVVFVASFLLLVALPGYWFQASLAAVWGIPCAIVVTLLVWQLARCRALLPELQQMDFVSELRGQ